MYFRGGRTVRTRAKRLRSCLLLVSTALLTVVANFIVVPNAGAATTKAAAGTPVSGGTLTELVPQANWSSLDPATDPQSAENQFFEEAIYGQLFEWGPNGSILGSEASGYKFSNGNKTVDIFIRPGIKFSNGDPFNAKAVAASIQRDILPKTGCECLTNFLGVKSVQAIGQYDVRLQMKTVESNIISLFPDEAPDYTTDPTALAKMGSVAYGKKPVGAGPFTVVSEQPNTQVTLTKNPHYFVKGRPYLSGLKIVATTTDQSDFESLQAGQAQLAEVSTPQIWVQAGKTPGLTHIAFPATTPYFVKFDTRIAPFNNPKAREAVAYATNAAAVVKTLYDSVYTPVEGLDAPGQAFYAKTVPDYIHFNLNKAKQLVKQIGTLKFTISTGNTPVNQEEAQEWQQQWDAAGMQATILPGVTLATFLSDFANHKPFNTWPGQWNCAPDPGDCDNEIIASNGGYSGDDDPGIDKLLAQGTSVVGTKARAKVYLEVNERLDKTAEIVPLYGKPQIYIATSNVKGIDTKVPSPVQYTGWDNVWLAK